MPLTYFLIFFFFVRNSTVLFHGAGRLEETGEFFLVNEFMANGDLMDGLSKRDPITNTPTLSWEKRLQIAADIAEGMKFLHSRTPPIIHRDLKSANVLLDYDNRAKIADFGLSRFAQAQQEAAEVVVRSGNSFVENDHEDYDHSLDNNAAAMIIPAGIIPGIDVTKAGGTTFYMSPESFGSRVQGATGGKNWLAKYDKPVDVCTRVWYSFA